MDPIWMILIIIIAILIYQFRLYEYFSSVPKEWTDRKDLYMMSLYDFISDSRTFLGYFKFVPVKDPSTEILPTIDLDGLKAIFDEKLTANGLTPANYNRDFLNIRQIASGAEGGYTYQDYLSKYEQRIYFFAKQDIAINGPKPVPQERLSRAQRLWPQVATLYMQFPLTS